MPPAGWIVASSLVLFGVLGLITTVIQRRGGTPAGSGSIHRRPAH
jgi:hypothetical protein